MKKINKLAVLFLSLFVSFFLLTSCANIQKEDSKDLYYNKVNDSELSKEYIKVNDSELSKEYIGYFFYVAQLNMIQEAGMVLGEDGNSTQADVDEFWKTTEIEGRKAVDVARDLAADNAVMQTVQYLKAVEEGITLSEEDKKDVDNQIQRAIESSGGEVAFNQKLSEMGCSKDAYNQILTENLFVKKLFEKYDSEGKFEVSQEEILAAVEMLQADSVSGYDPYSDADFMETVINSIKTDKFNAMSQEWEKDFDIVINDEGMKEFDVK